MLTLTCSKSLAAAQKADWSKGVAPGYTLSQRLTRPARLTAARASDAGRLASLSLQQQPNVKKRGATRSREGHKATWTTPVSSNLSFMSEHENSPRPPLPKGVIRKLDMIIIIGSNEVAGCKGEPRLVCVPELDTLHVITERPAQATAWGYKSLFLYPRIGVVINQRPQTRFLPAAVCRSPVTDVSLILESQAASMCLQARW